MYDVRVPAEQNPKQSICGKRHFCRIVWPTIVEPMRSEYPDPCCFELICTFSALAYAIDCRVPPFRVDIDPCHAVLRREARKQLLIERGAWYRLLCRPI
jgi:hypothetical protein